MNIPKLRGKMVELGFSVESLANEIGIDKSTLYRKLDEGEKFTIGEARKIRATLNLTSDEASVIFFGE